MLIVKQMTGSSYDQLSFHLGDGASYRALCRLGIGAKQPLASPLKRNLERVRAEGTRAQRGVEEGGLVSTACVTGTHIREPSDASLPWGCVRV